MRILTQTGDYTEVAELEDPADFMPTDAVRVYLQLDYLPKGNSRRVFGLLDRKPYIGHL